MCPKRVVENLGILYVDSKDSDQSGQISILYALCDTLKVLAQAVQRQANYFFPEVTSSCKFADYS